MRLLSEADIDQVSGGAFVLLPTLPAISAVQSAAVDAAKVAQKTAEAFKSAATSYLANT